MADTSAVNVCCVNHAAALLLCLGLYAGMPAGAQSAQILTLDDCLRRGLEGNLTLRMFRLELASASADVQRVSARYDPFFLVDGRYEDSELPPGSFPSDGGVERGLLGARLMRGFESGTQVGMELDFQRNLFEGIGPASDPLWRTAAGVTLRQSLWRNAWGSSGRAQVDYVRQRVRSLELEYQRAAEQVASQIMDHYWRTLTARRVAGSQEAVIDRLGRLLEVNRRRFREGLLDESAVLAVEAALAVAEVDIELFWNDALTLDEELKERIDLPAREWDAWSIDYRLPDESGGADSIPAFADAYEAALHYRADVEALRHEERRVEELIRWRQSEDRPDLEISGGFGRGDSGESFGDTFGFDKNLWSVGILLDMSLKRSDTRAAVAQAYLERERIRTELEMLERRIELDCRVAVRQYATALRLVTATRRALDAQTRKLELELDRFQRGQSDTKTLLDYENDREAAERDWVTAQGARQRARVALDLVQGIVPTGGGW